MKLRVTVDGTAYEVEVEVINEHDKPAIELKNKALDDHSKELSYIPRLMAPAVTSEDLKAPADGTVIEILRKVGAEVKYGEPLMVFDMGIRSVLIADRDVKIDKIHVSVADKVTEGALLISFKEFV